jgi:hypothetical protein
MANDTFSIYDESQPTYAKQFCKDFLNTEVGKRFSKLYDSGSAQEAWDGVIAKFRRIHGDDPIILGDLKDFVSDLLLSGGLRAPDPPAPQEKQLSASQKQWQEFRIYSEEHTMAQCKARAQQDSGYASFIRLNLERESINRDPNAPVNLNANRTPAANPISPELARFVEDYRSMPMDKVRKLSSPATNPAGKSGADHFNSLLNRAIELGVV